MDTPVTQHEGELPGAEGAVPIPPRYWWLKRILVACAVLLVMLVGLHCGWGYWAQWQLQAEIDRLWAAGEPILPEDFDTPPVPEAENAVTVLTAAASAFVKPAGVTKDISDLVSSSEFTSGALAEATLYVDANTNALRLAHQVRDRAQADWAVQFRTLAFSIVLPALWSHRELAQFLAVAARYYHHTGEEAHAVAVIRDVLTITRVIDHYPTLIGHLVAISTRALAARSVECMAPELAVLADFFDHRPGIIPAARTDVEALIAELLDERTGQTGFVRAMQCQRMVLVDYIEYFGRIFTRAPSAGPGTARTRAGGVAGGAARIGVLLGPVLQLQGEELLHLGTAWIEAAQEPTWPSLCRRRPPDPRAKAGWWAALSQPFILPLEPSSLERTALLHYYALADCRMAATALAVRLYEIDQGHRPRSLTDLVPAYMTEIPGDPFAPDGGPVRYRPEASPPVLYCVGPNGVDDHGAFSFRRSWNGGDWDALDVPFFLDGRPPSLP